jgi:hypothetical protein
MKLESPVDRMRRARVGLMELGVLPEAAKTLVDGLEQARNCFFCWSLMLMHTRISPMRCKTFLEMHGYYPGRAET